MADGTGRPSKWAKAWTPGASFTLEYNPTPRQAAFHASNADVALFGGAAGPGKSRALLMEALIQMMETPGSYGILMRRTFPELEKSLILESLKLFPRKFCRYNEIKHRWTIQTHGGPNSVLDFGFCRTEHDVYQYRSAEFTFLGIDELTHFSWPMFAELVGRVRSSIPGAWPRIRCASNPGNIGHGWVKQYFSIDKCDLDATWIPEPTEQDPKPLSRAFFPAKLTDNPHIDPRYVQRLSTLPPTQRKMLIDGDWSTFSGKFFNELSDAHFIDPIKLNPEWKYYRAVDYGFTAPFSCLWIAAAPDGHYYVYRQLYLSGLRDKEQATMIARFTKEKIEYSVGDPSMANKNASGFSPQENYLSEADIALFPGDNHRVPGWMAVRNMLALHPDGTPILRIFKSACPDLKRELEEAITDDKNPEDVNTNTDDHAIDALRYFCMSRPLDFERKPVDRFAKMDPGTASEWRAHQKMIKAASAEKNVAILADFNREDDGHPDIQY